MKKRTVKKDAEILKHFRENRLSVYRFDQDKNYVGAYIHVDLIDAIEDIGIALANNQIAVVIKADDSSKEIDYQLKPKFEDVKKLEVNLYHLISKLY